MTKILVTAEDVMVFRDDKYDWPNYSIQVSSKNRDNSWSKSYQQIKFRKGVELENRAIINITDAFPVVEEWTDRDSGKKRSKIVWMILDFEYADEPAPDEDVEDIDGFAEALDDIPFY